MKLGKLPAKVDGRTLRLERYLVSEALPEVPAARDLAFGHDYDTDPLGNDAVGDCAYAAPGHLIALASRLSGLPNPVTAAGVLAAYSAGTGYDPAVPGSDKGAYLLDVLKQWRGEGICGVRCEAFVSVALDHADAALDLFGGVIVGLQLPESCFASDLWDDVDPNSPIAGGHAVYVHAVSPGIWVCDSWGQRRAMTRAFVYARADEAFAALLPDRPAPSGLDLASLRADLSRLT
jgi:hypothetical protein